jgi:hypothetical protein
MLGLNGNSTLLYRLGIAVSFGAGERKRGEMRS